MSQFSPIRTNNPDLDRVQDRIRDTATATTAKLNDLQTQLTANAKLTVTSTSTSAISTPDTDVTIANATAGMTIQLPDATKISKLIRYKNTSASNTLTLLCVSVGGIQQQINGANTLTVAVSTSVAIVSDGSNFHTI